MPINLEDKDYQGRITLTDVQRMDDATRGLCRYMCQSDLRFLANCVLRPNNPKRFPTLIEKVHGKIIDALPQPKPDKEWYEWDEKDEFVVLASRGMLKSTIGAAFLTQNILAFPDIRILIMSGKIDKAKSILSVARKPFFTNDVIRFLFPEWAIDDDEGAEEFTCPYRNPELDLRDPTLSVASFDSVKAGGHYELILLDDATNEINSSTPENCEKTFGTYDDTDELVEPVPPTDLPNCTSGGYRVFLGTKWLEEDLPEYIRKKGAEDAEKSGKATVSYFKLPAWTLRTDGTPLEREQRKEREKVGTLTPDDVILTWPEKLNATFLFKRYRKNRADFYKQYLLDASIEQQRSFDDATLTRQFRPQYEVINIPKHDRTVICYWDLSSVWTGRRKKSDSDFSCGIVAVFQNSTGKMYVVDCILDHFTSGRDVANAVIRLYKNSLWWSSEGSILHGMEDAAGARNLESQIHEIAAEQNINLPSITWWLTENTLNIKNINIGVLASAMQADSVIICSNIPYVDDIKAQFEKWSIDAKRRKDDGPDCIAQVWQHYRLLIKPNIPKSLEPSGPIMDWEIPAPVEFKKEAEPEPDYHAEEAENADINWLKSFTVGN